MSQVQFIITFVMTLLITITIAVLAVNNASLRGQLATVNADYVVAKSENADLGNAADACNASIQTLKAMAQKYQTALEIAENKANVVNGNYAALAAKIQTAKVSADDCKGAKQLLNQFVGGQ